MYLPSSRTAIWRRVKCTTEHNFALSLRPLHVHPATASAKVRAFRGQPSHKASNIRLEFRPTTWWPLLYRIPDILLGVKRLKQGEVSFSEMADFSRH